MKIVVLVKEVPDTFGDRKLSLETGLADRTASEPVLDEIGERSLEVALTYADDHADAEVVVLSMAPESAAETIRKGLAMGATSAVHVVDDDLLGADLGLTAEVLAAALTRSGFDLVITGNISTDGSGGVLPVMLAELLDVPALTNLTAVEISQDAVAGERASDGATMRLSAPLPAVVSVTEQVPEGRFPTFKSIKLAKKKSVETLGLGDLGVDPDNQETSRSIMIAVSEKPPRRSGVKIVDESDGGEQLAEFLIKNRLA